MAFGAIWGWAVGPQWNWDRANHHVYAALQWLDGRLGEGVQPAGGQTFLNPLAYVPAVALERAGWSPPAVAMALGAVQAIGVLAVWLIARACVGRMHPGRVAVPAIAAVLALATPVFLLTLGTTYSDGTTGVGVLIGVWCALRAVDGGPRPLCWAAAAGFAMGTMVGLKLSNLLPAALGLLLIAVPPAGVNRSRWAGAWAGYLVACVVGAALTHGAWSVQLQRVAGHPLYPTLGSVQRSEPNPTPAVVAQSAAAQGLGERLAELVGRTRISGTRFTPESLTDWVSFPLRVADPSFPGPQAYVEARYPDPRLAVLAALAAALALRALGRTGFGAWRRTPQRPGAQDVAAPSGRPVARLCVFVALWYLGWTLSSSNGRYGLALLMLLSVPLAIGAFSLLAPGRARVYGLGALLALQLGYAFAIPEHFRGDPARAWAEGGFEAELPASLRDEPWLHVPVTLFSGSYLLPAMHRDSTFANLASVCEHCAGPRGVEHARAVLERWDGRVRVLVPVDRINDGRPGLSEGLRSAADGLLADYGLRLDVDRCDYFRVRPNLWGATLIEANGDDRKYKGSDLLASCRAVTDPAHADALRARRVEHDDAFAAIERVCGAELGGASGATRLFGQERWARIYAGPEWVLVVDTAGMYATSRRGETHRVGDLDAVRRGVLDCSSLRRHVGGDVARPFDPASFSSGWTAPEGRSRQ